MAHVSSLKVLAEMEARKAFFFYVPVTCYVPFFSCIFCTSQLSLAWNFLYGIDFVCGEKKPGRL